MSNGKQFFSTGQANLSGGTPTKFYYNRDHLGSIRELTDSTGAIKTRYSFDPYGQVAETFVAGSISADMQYDGYYVHGRSGLNMPVYRAYNAALGRFFNRDPIDEKGGLNLFAYTLSNPVGFTDPLGLECPKGPLVDAIVKKFEMAKALQKKTSMGGLETGGIGVWNNGKFTTFKWGTPTTSSSFILDTFPGMTDVIQNHLKVPPLTDADLENNPSMTAMEDVQKSVDNSSRLWTLGSDGDITMYNGTTHTGQCTVQTCIYDSAGNFKRECKADCTKMGSAH